MAVATALLLAAGHGPALQASTATTHRPLLLIVLLCAVVLSVAMLIARRLINRHARRSEAVAAPGTADAEPVEDLQPIG